MNHTSTSVSPEVVAAITAALSVVLDQPVGQFAITGIQPEGAAPGFSVPVPVSGWARAGVLECHLSRRQFGFRSR